MPREYDEPIRASFDPSVEAEAGFSEKAMREQAEAEALADLEESNARGMTAQEAANIQARDSFKAEEARRGPSDTDHLRARAREVDYGLSLAATPATRGVSTPNRMYKPVQEYARTTEEAMAERAAGVAAEHNYQDQVALANQQHALDIARQAEQFQQQQQARMVRQEQERETQMAAIREATQLHNASVEELMNAPPLDPGKAREEMWAKASHGRRFGLVLSVLGKGLAAAGGLNITSRLEQEVENEIAANKYNRDFLSTKLGARAQQLSVQQTLWERIRDKYADDNAADAAFRATMYDYAVKQYEATLAQLGPAGVDASQLQTMAELKAKDAAAKLDLQKQLVDNPKRVAGVAKVDSVPVLDGTGQPVIGADGQQVRLPRAVAQYRAAEQAAERKAGLEVRQAGAEAGAKAAAEQPFVLEREEAKAQGKGGGLSESDQRAFEQRKYVEKESREYRAEMKLIDDFLSAYGTGIPGLTFGVGWTPNVSDEARKAYDAATRIVFKRLRRESGAAIPDEEIKREAESVVRAWDEDDVRINLRARREEAQYNVDLIERAPGEEQLQGYTRSEAAPRTPLPTGGTGLADPVRWRP